MTPEQERPLGKLSTLEQRLLGEPNLASVMFFKAFSQLCTAGCLEIRAEWDPPLYRQAEGIDLSLLSPEERIVFESAGSFHGECLEDLLPRARKRIREAIPESSRAITAEEESLFAELRAMIAQTLRTAISEALAYEIPASSCSV
jgi:hypothetical protein